MFSRLLTYSVYGAIGATGLTLFTHKDDLESLAIVRLGRAAYTTFDIGYLYKTQLYHKKWDETSHEYSEQRSKVHKIGAEKLLALCRSNKGVYIKVGQHIGALDYLVPSEYVETMRVLHKDAPQNPVKELNKVIKEDLNKDINEIFIEFDSKPLGTASLAQVHKAKLVDGTPVAVKVQHYYVRKNINIDLNSIEFLVKIMSKIFPEFQLNWLVSETKHNIYKELSFINEGKNAEKISEMFKDYKWLKVPKIFWDYSTERVLVMEYVDGGQINDLNYIKANNIDPYGLSYKIGDLYSHMIFVRGFVHSDPHPGNILVKKSPKDKDVTVYLLDHGLYATLTEQFRYNYSRLWFAIINKDKEGMKKYAASLGIRPELYGLFASIVSGRPWTSIVKGIGSTKPDATEKDIFQKHVPEFLNRITEVLETVDRQALLIFKTNDLIKSIEYTLGTHQRMCGFMVMTKCVMESIHKVEYAECKSYMSCGVKKLSYMWSIVGFYIYSFIMLLKSELSS